jgi:hypothetical protein
MRSVKVLTYLLVVYGTYLAFSSLEYKKPHKPFMGQRTQKIATPKHHSYILRNTEDVARFLARI